MAVRVHVLRTCDRCGKPVEVEGSVPLKQLKEGDVIPTFQGPTLRIVREEPSLDGSAPAVKVLGVFVDVCAPCENVIKTALATLLKTPTDAEGEASEKEKETKRKGRAPKPVQSDMPGPNGPVAAVAEAPAPTPVAPAAAEPGSSPSLPPAEAPPEASSTDTVFSAEMPDPF